MAELTLAEVAAPRGLVGGPFGSSLVGSDYSVAGIPVIRGANLGGRHVGGEFAFVTREKFKRDLTRNNAEPGDLVYTQRGTLGQVSIVPPEPYGCYVVSQSQMRLRVDPLRADPWYVYYVCSGSEFKKKIFDNAIATGVPHINLGILSRLTIPSPPLSTQRAIAEVLRAFDDRIAANDRSLGLVSRLADAHFVHSVMGVPLGAVFGDLAEVGGGGTPRTAVAEYWDGEVPWATPTDVTGLSAPYLSKTSRAITDAGLAACSSSLYPAGSILMTSRATIGAFAVTQAPLAVNQGFIVVNAKDPDLQWWLYHEMRSRVDEFRMYANGATFLELPRGRFKQLPVRKPDMEIGRAFSAAVAPLHELAAGLLRQNERLASTRDEMLPLLISGRLRVKDAARAVEEVL